MTRFEYFLLLSQDLQAGELLQSGVYLELIRETHELTIELYALHDFYVEVYYDKKTEGPLDLRAFDSMKDLEPYLSLFEIEDIFEIK
jgi:hypothetical protein